MASTRLPPASSVVAVCAHPDDESFGLGAVLTAFAAAGARLTVVSCTAGEASTLGAEAGDLARRRAGELAAAGEVLGVSSTALLEHPDGRLGTVPLEDLVAELRPIVAGAGADLLLVFDRDGVTGHPDHRRATEAALALASDMDLAVLAWALPEALADGLNRALGTAFGGRRPEEVDLFLSVRREVQLAAIACHDSQARDNPVLAHRLAAAGDTECLVWLRPPPRGTFGP